MAVRRADINTFSLGGTPAKPDQVGLSPRFIEKNQLGRIPTRLLLAPTAARPDNVGPVLFAGAEGLFL